VKRAEVEAGHPMISVVRQCELLSMSRSSFYYCPGAENEYNLTLTRLIDEEFTRHPFYGARRTKAWLRARLDPFVLSATIRRKLDRIWALRTKNRISPRNADPAQETAEAQDLAQTLARRMQKKRNGSTRKNDTPQHRH